MPHDDTFHTLLHAVGAGTMSVDEALAYCAGAGAGDDLPYATLDHLRRERTGFGEVVYCPGKTDEQIAAIVERLANQSGVVLATRATIANYEAVKAVAPDAAYEEDARIIAVERVPLPRLGHAV